MSDPNQKKQSAILAEAFEAMKNRGEKSVESVCAEIVQKHGGNAEESAAACQTHDRVDAEVAKLHAAREKDGVSFADYLQMRLKEILGDDSLVQKVMAKIKGFFAGTAEKLRSIFGE